MKKIRIEAQIALLLLSILFSVLFAIDIMSEPAVIIADGDPAVVSIVSDTGDSDANQIKFNMFSENAKLYKRTIEANYDGNVFDGETQVAVLIYINQRVVYINKANICEDYTCLEILKTSVFTVHESPSNSADIPLSFVFEKNYLINISKNKRKEIVISYYAFNIVTFDGNGGTLISGEEVQKVAEGENAVAPTYEREGYEFVGFDVDYENPTDDITVTAIWNEEETPVAPETPVPEMNEGAAIRISGEKDNGIRFSANIPKSYVEEYENNGYTLSYGMFIVPADYLSDVGELTSENLFGENSVYVFDVGAEYSGEKTIIIRLDCDPSDDGEDNYVIKASIVNIHRTNLSRKFVARGYIAKTKGGVTEYEMINYYGGNVENNKRDVLSVAHAAYDDEETDPETKSVIYEIYLK